jgi:hypothetical protein
MHGDGGGGGFSGDHSGGHFGGHSEPAGHHSPAHHAGQHRADGQVPPYGADPATDPHARHRHRRGRTAGGTVVRWVFLGIAVTIVVMIVAGAH